MQERVREAESVTYWGFDCMQERVRVRPTGVLTACKTG